MLRRVTTLAALLLLPFAVQAQEVAEVTVKEINTPHADSLQKAIDQQATLTQAQLERLLASPYAGKQVRFTAVILTDVYNSGNASPTSAGIPGRVHIFMRDPEAVQDGEVMPGYTIQVVDGNWQTTGWQNYLPGNVVTVTGRVEPFNGTIQVTPTTVTLEADSYEELDLPASIMEPLEVSLAEIHTAGLADENFPQAQSMLNLPNWSSYVGEYVKLGSMTIGNSNEWQAGRYNILFLDPGTQRAIEFQDISVRYRNDRVGTAYETAGFNVREADNPFAVPAIGSSVNIAGFLTYSRFDGFNYFNPNNNLRIVPMMDSDLEVLPGGPPTAANVSTPSGLVTGTADVTITADVTPGEGRTLTTVELLAGAPGATPTSYAMTLTSGTQYSGTIPTSALNDGDFVEYMVKATDNAGATTESVPLTFRVLTQINSISDIQQTANGGPGRSPLTGLVVTSESGLMDLEVVVQTDADSTNLFTVQDGTEPWSGMFLAPSNDLRALAPGATIRITGGEVEERFDVTQLRNITFTVVSETGTPYAPVEVPTTALLDVNTAEAHEGMIVRFNNVEIASTNPDGPNSNFGEWSFQTVGTTDAIRADDQSNGIPSTFNGTLEAGAKYAYIQGVWYFSFGNWKLLPQYLSDIVIATSNEGAELPVGFGLGQSYPNPARGAVAVPFSLETAGFVTLDVYDTLGRRVARIAAEDRPAGQQEVAFDTRNLSAGLYLVRLSAGDKTETRSLVVVR